MFTESRVPRAVFSQFDRPACGGSLMTVTREPSSAISCFISPNLADQIEESLGDGVTELPFLGRR